MTGRKKRDPRASLQSALQSQANKPMEVKPEDTPRLPSTAPGIQFLERSHNAIKQIDPDLIDDTPFVDRMELFGDHEDTLEQMVASIQEHGQTVPIMVRNSEKEKGRYEVIFGRRRLAAIRYIRAQPRPHETEEDSNLKIKANIQTRAYGQPEDEFSTQVLVAQALENAARKDLSVYESARFAKLIFSSGVPKKQVASMMNMSATNLSNLFKITRLVPDCLGNLIGAAPGSGRPKWEALAVGLENKVISVEAAKQLLSDLDPTKTSDDRLSALLEEIRKKSESVVRPEIRALGGFAKVQKGPSGLKVTVTETEKTKGFSDWLDANIEKILRESLIKFESERDEKS